MMEKIPRLWIILVVLLTLGIVAVLAGKGFLGIGNKPDGENAALEGKSRELEEKERRIRGLESQIGQQRKDLEENSNRVAELQTRLEETGRALSATEQKLRIALRRADHPPTTPSRPQEKTISKPVEPVSPPPWRRPSEPGSYEVIRPTAVFAEPSDFSRKVSTITKGTRVTVVGSVGEWLEVRSKHGNPPGFIRRDDAMYVEKRD